MNSGLPDPQTVAVEICTRLNASFDRSLGSGAHKQAFLISLRGAPVALKIASVTANLRARFERETAALQSCSHPAVAKLLFIAPLEVLGHEYWVIGEEFLAGGTLSERLQQGALTREQTAAIGLTLAGALAHLQERNFVHRDVKPANILFRESGEPVLTDFGIVRILDEPSLTHDFLAQGPGTPLYAAPEQLHNDKALIDWRTDQFGLALVLAECILGRPAFATTNQSARDAVMAVANRTELPESSRNELESARLGCIVKALSPWPVQRYRRPADFIYALTE